MRDTLQGSGFGVSWTLDKPQLPLDHRHNRMADFFLDHTSADMELEHSQHHLLCFSNEIKVKYNNGTILGIISSQARSPTASKRIYLSSSTKCVWVGGTVIMSEAITPRLGTAYT